jgi:hypothetical protein
MTEPFTFLIPACINNDVQYRQLLRCIESIQTYHDHSDIIIISTGQQEINIESKNIKIFKPIYKNIGELQPFYFILNHSKTDLNVTMHDSMLLNKKLEIDNVRDIKFLWHATNHRLHWDIIKEPETEYNTAHDIVSHTDLIRHLINKNFSGKLAEYGNYMLDNKEQWAVGCGVSCVIRKNYLKLLDDACGIIKFFNTLYTRRHRIAAESILPIICKYYDYNKNLEDSISGCVYDGITTNPYTDTVYMDGLKYHYKTDYFSKVCFGR